MKKTFDVDYAQVVPENRAKARRCADEWRLYIEHHPVSKPEEWWRSEARHQWRERLLTNLETEIRSAIETEDASFFLKFAYFLQHKKEPDPISVWLLDLHMSCSVPAGKNFTHKELIQLAVEKGFYRGRDEANIRRQLKGKMDALGFKFLGAK